MNCYRLLYAFLLLGCTQLMWAQSTKVEVDFIIKNAGIAVNGKFERSEANVVLNTERIEQSKIEGTIKANSINTGIASRDKHLRKSEYFDVEQYPTISIASVRFEKRSENTFYGFFNLTLKGITRKVEFPFTLESTPKNTIYKATFELNRRDYKVGGKSLFLSDNVIVNVVITQLKAL